MFIHVPQADFYVFDASAVQVCHVAGYSVHVAAEDVEAPAHTCVSHVHVHAEVAAVSEDRCGAVYYVRERVDSIHFGQNHRAGGVDVILVLSLIVPPVVCVIVILQGWVVPVVNPHLEHAGCEAGYRCAFGFSCESGCDGAAICYCSNPSVAYCVQSHLRSQGDVFHLVSAEGESRLPVAA